MLKLLILTIQANYMGAIMQTHDLNLGFLCNCIGCLKNFAGINIVHTSIMLVLLKEHQYKITSTALNLL